MSKLPEKQRNETKRKVKQRVSSSEVQEIRAQLYGTHTVEETVVPSKVVSDVKKGLVKTTDVQQYLKRLKLLESKKKARD